MGIASSEEPVWMPWVIPVAIVLSLFFVSAQERNFDLISFDVLTLLFTCYLSSARLHDH